MRELGRTGIQVSAYCLATMMFGRLGNPDHEDCARTVHRGLDAGINFIDTADVHGCSENEDIVGKALRGRRDDVVLATKVNGRTGEGPNRGGGSRDRPARHRPGPDRRVPGPARRHPPRPAPPPGRGTGRGLTP